MAQFNPLSQLCPKPALPSDFSITLTKESSSLLFPKPSTTKSHAHAGPVQITKEARGKRSAVPEKVYKTDEEEELLSPV